MASGSLPVSLHGVLGFLARQSPDVPDKDTIEVVETSQSPWPAAEVALVFALISSMGQIVGACGGVLTSDGTASLTRQVSDEDRKVANYRTNLRSVLMSGFLGFGAGMLLFSVTV